MYHSTVGSRVIKKKKKTHRTMQQIAHPRLSKGEGVRVLGLYWGKNRMREWNSFVESPFLVRRAQFNSSTVELGSPSKTFGADSLG